MKSLSQIAVVLCVLAGGCAGMNNAVRDTPIAVLNADGVVSQMLTVDSGGLLTFLNGDGKAHQIYSPECPELDSTILQPGQLHSAALGEGPKLCHFQDLLAPSAAAYGGSVEVRPAPRDPYSDSAP